MLTARALTANNVRGIIATIYFVTAARLGNITRAAEKLYVSQPALSAQFKALEEELGCKLLKKISSGIQLTAKGMLFLQRVNNILEMVSKTKNDFANLDGNPVGDIHISCAETASKKICSIFISRFSASTSKFTTS